MHVLATYGETVPPDPPTTMSLIGQHSLLQVYETTDRDFAILRDARRYGAQANTAPRSVSNRIPLAYSGGQSLLEYMDSFVWWAESSGKKLDPCGMDVGGLRSKLLEYARGKALAWMTANPHHPVSLRAARAGNSQRATTTARGRSRSTRGGAQGRPPATALPAPTSHARASTPSSVQGTRNPGHSAVVLTALPPPNTGAVACTDAVRVDSSRGYLGTEIAAENPTQCPCAARDGVPCHLCVRHWRKQTMQAARAVDQRVGRRTTEVRALERHRVDVDAALAMAEQERTELRVQIDAVNSALEAERIRWDAALQAERAQWTAALQQERELRFEARGQMSELRAQVAQLIQLQGRPVMTQMMTATGQTQAVGFPQALATSPLSAAMADSPPGLSRGMA